MFEILLLLAHNVFMQLLHYLFVVSQNQVITFTVSAKSVKEINKYKTSAKFANMKCVIFCLDTTFHIAKFFRCIPKKNSCTHSHVQLFERVKLATSP